MPTAEFLDVITVLHGSETVHAACMHAFWIYCSGQVRGRSRKAQRARQEYFQWGQSSLHVFLLKLSFAYKSALAWQLMLCKVGEGWIGVI